MLGEASVAYFSHICKRHNLHFSNSKIINPTSTGIQLANKYHKGQKQWKDIIKIGSFRKLTEKQDIDCIRLFYYHSENTRKDSQDWEDFTTLSQQFLTPTWHCGLFQIY